MSAIFIRRIAKDRREFGSDSLFEGTLGLGIVYPAFSLAPMNSLSKKVIDAWSQSLFPVASFFFKIIDDICGSI